MRPPLDPTTCTWLDPLTALPALNKLVVRRAHRFIGIEEVGGANRSGVIDDWNRRAGAPLGSPWCASFATAVWEDCGARLPAHGRASCDVLMTWAKNVGLWTDNPIEGALVLYGVPGDARHVGVVARLLPRQEARAVEGNTTFAGFSREGTAVVYKPVDRTRVLGYVVPAPA